MVDRALLIEHREKIRNVLLDCIIRLYQKNDEELLAYIREQNTSLIDFLDDENRWMAVLNGEPVTPKVHNVQAVLHAAFGGGGM